MMADLQPGSRSVLFYRKIQRGLRIKQRFKATNLPPVTAEFQTIVMCVVLCTLLWSRAALARADVHG